MREARGPEWTDWLAERGIVALTGIDTRSLVLRLREGGAMRAAAVAGDAGRGRGAGRRSASCRRWRAPRSSPSSPRRSRTSTATRARSGSRSSTTAASARSCGGSPAPGPRVTVFPHTVDADELAGYDAVAPLERPRRPRAARRRGRRSCASCSAACRSSASASATSCSASRPGTRRSSSPSATAAPTIRCSSGERPRARDQPEPRLRGRALGRRRGDARLALRRHRRGLRLPGAARALGAVPPRGRPRPARRLADPRDAGCEEVRDAA